MSSLPPAQGRASFRARWFCLEGLSRQVLKSLGGSTASHDRVGSSGGKKKSWDDPREIFRKYVINYLSCVLSVYCCYSAVYFTLNYCYCTFTEMYCIALGWGCIKVHAWWVTEISWELRRHLRTSPPPSRWVMFCRREVYCFFLSSLLSKLRFRSYLTADSVLL